MKSNVRRFSELLLSGFLLAWFVCGNCWVFGVWLPNFDQQLHAPSRWCDRTVYILAVVHIIVCHAVILVVIIIAIAAGLSRCISSAGDP